ncbi:hypothetical protein [Brevundimonas faecalis]|uniref:Uncharacterized protein n=1 Tax=Brevundimonas faecalis TaxID=947378 RepID=A0ABV2RGI1_9CAUL
MTAQHNPTPPGDEGDWTLLQNRIDRSFWQWDRCADPGARPLTRFVILRAPERLDYDDFDEAEAMFEAMDED